MIGRPTTPLPRADERFVAALRFRALTAIYDPLLRLTLPEQRIKASLLAQAAIVPGHRVLDLGCGTGTLTRMIQSAHPNAHVTGLDPDVEALAIAREKAALEGLPIEFTEGTAAAPPFAPEGFDRVLSSLMFHHLVRAQKQRALRAAFELLRPGGELHIADWGRPQDLWMQLAFLPVRLLDGFAPTRDNATGRLPGLVREAGFVGFVETSRTRTLYGTLTLLRAARPPP